MNRKILLAGVLAIVVLFGIFFYVYQSNFTARVIEPNSVPNAAESQINECSGGCNPKNIGQICNEGKWNDCNSGMVCSLGECVLPNDIKDKVIVSATSGGGGGSGGGGSSNGGSSEGSAATKDIYLGEISGSILQEFGKNDRLLFSINDFDYSLTLNELSETVATINVNDGSVLLITVGEERGIDLNGDSSNDLLIRLKSINVITKKAKLIINVL